MSSVNSDKNFLSVHPRPAAFGGSNTHEVTNMPPEMPDQNLFLGDEVLTSALKREGVEWVMERATEVGKLAGSRYYQDLARLANDEKPVLHTHNRVGQRIDFVEFHPAYHELMAGSQRSGVHSLAWTSQEKRPQIARAVLFYLWNQVDNGTISCPGLMTYAIVPLLKSDPEIGDRWLAKVLSPEYDPRQIPASEKAGITVAMGMTEKQGGSDVRANSTRAVPTGGHREYLLTGHKFFASAPMGDIFLLTAKTENGISLFIAPRILENGERNNISIQRLKNKVGNDSNASSEVELDNTIAYRIGEEGHGIRQFVKYMTHYIRMGLSLSSAGLMRRALNLAIHHTSNRAAFGSTVREMPMMQNTLADLAIESEAATLLGLRVAKALDDAPSSESDEMLNRILVPIAKYWNCRRASAFTLEAMECHGGMGYVEEQTIGRLYREAPLNSIWEGTSAMMGLDVMRAMERTPGAKEALLQEINLAKGANRHFDLYVAELEAELDQRTCDFEPHARRLMGMIAKAVQGSLLIRQSIPEVAEAFCSSRLGGHWGHEFGTLDQTVEALRKIVDRAEISC